MADGILAAPEATPAPAADPAQTILPLEGVKAPEGGTQEATKEGQPAEAAAATPAEAKKEIAAPEIEVKLPEGVEADPELLAGLKSVAKDAAGAQKLADLYVAAQARAAEKSKAEWTQTVKGWQQEIKDDQEFGGKSLAQNMAHAQKAMAQFGSPELTKFLTDTGLMHRPEIVRWAMKAGQALAEDTIAGTAASGGTSSVKPGLTGLYDNSPELT